MTTTTKWTASDMVRQNVKLSSPPLIYNKLMRVLDDPRSGSNDLGNVISEDQGLAARILALVNSALFSLPWKVESISAAVRVVGTAQIRDIALATSVLSMFSEVPSDLLDVDSFRHHSLACGVGARVLAGHRGEDNPERFFVAGLLHDIGKLLIVINAPDQARAALEKTRETGKPLREFERDLVGCPHDQVGGTLLEKWSFPDALAEAVRYHHQPIRASRFPIEAAAVHVADVIAHGMAWGRSGQPIVPPFDGDAWSQLGIEMTMVPSLLEECERQLEAALVLIPSPA